MRIVRIATVVAFVHISIGWCAFFMVKTVPNSYGFGLVEPFELLYPVFRILGPCLGLVWVCFYAKCLWSKKRPDLLWTISSLGLLAGYIAKWIKDS